MLLQKRKIVEQLEFTQFKASMKKIYLEISNNEYIKNLIINLDDLYYENKLHSSQSLYEPAVSSLIEQAAVGLKVIESCNTEYKDFYDIARDFGVVNWSGPDTTTRQLKKIREKYVLPFFDYLIQNISESSENYTVINRFDKAFHFINELEFTSRFPKTNKLIKKTSNLFHSKKQINWNSVANSCRDTLIVFSNELKNKYGTQKVDDIKDGDVKSTLKLFLNSHNRYQNSVIELIESLWNHISSATHKNDLGRNDAIRIFVWMTLIINEVELIIKERILQAN